MKIYIQNLALTAAVIAFGSCNSNKTELKTEASNFQNESTVSQTQKGGQRETKMIEGKVESVTMGKDGYSAMVKSEDGENYNITVSHSNMITPQQYRVFKANESVTVLGEAWEMEGVKQLTVHIIQ